MPRLVPALLTLLALSAALGAYFLIAPALSAQPYYRHIPNRVTTGYSRQVLVLFIPYAVAVWAWWRGERTALWLVVAGAVALHLLVGLAPPPGSQDFYQYLFYGRMQAAHGANPYVVVPSAFHLDPWFRMIRWPTQTSVYGPAWTLLSWGVARAAGSSLILGVVYLKLIVLALDLAVMGFIVSLAKGAEDPAGAAGWGLLLYAWNPLVLVAVPLSGLADVGVAAGILAAVLARRRGRPWLATALLALATMVKVYAGIGLLLHLALELKERGPRRAAGETAVAAGLFALAFSPYWAGWRTFRGLLDVASQANNSLTGTLQYLIGRSLRALGVGSGPGDAALALRWLAGAAVAAATVWAVRRVRDDATLWYGTLAVLAVYLLVSPRFLYWYLVAPLALVAVLPRNRLTVPLLVSSATSLVALAYAPWSVFRVVQTVFRYGPPVATYAGRPRGRARKLSPGAARHE